VFNVISRFVTVDVSVFVENGALYTCGECESGKLGLPDSLTNITSPQKVTLGVAVKSVFCGGNHTIALTGKKRFCSGIDGIACGMESFFGFSVV
jgi:alpha-tubulin suppressor-like RCC1 family protein